MKETDARLQSLDKLILLLKEKKAKQKQVFQIFAKNIDGKTYTINDVDSSCTVREIKLKIEDKIGLPIEEQRLIYQGKQLEEDQEISYYDIEKESTIHIVLSLKGGFGELLGEVAEYLGVENSFSVIAEALGITPAMLGAGLMVGGLASWSVIKIVNYFRNGNSEQNDLEQDSDNENGEDLVNKGFQIFVKSPHGETYTLNNIEEETTVVELKAKLEEKIGLPVDEQKLMYGGKELTKEENTVVQEGIKARVTLFVYLPLPKSNTLEDVKQLSENLLDDLRKLESKFDFLEEEAQKPFLDIFNVLIESEDLEAVNQLYDELIVIHGELIKNYEQLIWDKEEECRGIEDSLEEVIQKMNLLNESEFLEEKEQIDINSIEEKISLITERDLSLHKIQEYTELLVGMKEICVQKETYITQLEKEWETLTELAKDHIKNLEELKLSVFLSEDDLKTIDEVHNGLLEISKLVSGLEQIASYKSLIEKSEEEGNRLNKTINNNKIAYENEKESLLKMQIELTDAQSDQFLKEETFEEINLWNREVDEIKEKAASLEVLVQINEFIGQVPELLKILESKKIENQEKWEGIKIKANEGFDLLGKQQKKAFLKKEVVVVLGEITPEFEELESLTYTMDHYSRYLSFVEDLNGRIHNLEVLEKDKMDIWSQLVEETTKVRGLVNKIKASEVQVEQVDKDLVKEKTEKSYTVDEMKTRLVFLKEFIEKYNGRLYDVKLPVLDLINEHLATLKGGITTYYKTIERIQKKFNIEIRESEYPDLLEFKDCLNENKVFSEEEDYEVLIRRRDELESAIDDIDRAIEVRVEELNQEIPDLSGWKMNTMEVNGVSEKTIRNTEEGDEYLEKLAKGQLNDRHGGSTILLNKPLHQHLNGGSSGMSFYYKEEENGTITPIVYDYARDREGNKYNWKNGKQSSGPSNSSDR